MTGWVYAFVTPSMPGIVKIGATTRDVAERLCEANASHTWCPPEPYVVVCCVEVEDPLAVERGVHAAIRARRVSPRREFFHATPEEVSSLFGMLVPMPAPQPGAALSTSAQRAPCAQCAPYHAAAAAQAVSLTPESKLRAWVDAQYARVPLREKDTGTKLEHLYSAYMTCVPPVHTRLLGKILFAKMLCELYTGIGPHRGTDGSKGLFLVR